jgi:hypothetical protein
MFLVFSLGRFLGSNSFLTNKGRPKSEAHKPYRIENSENSSYLAVGLWKVYRIIIQVVKQLKLVG